MKRATPTLLLPLLACVAALPGAGITYSFQQVSYPGDTFTNLLGINNSGEISGFHGAVTSQGFTLVLPNSFTTQNFPGSASSMAVGINNLGSTGGIYVDNAGTTHGYTDIGGTFSTVDAPGTAFNQILGINDNNETVGYFSTDPTGMTLQMADSQMGGVFTNINSLLPANFNSQATGLNNAGTVVGFYMPTASTSIGFLDTGGTISTIDPFTSTFTQALGINNMGEIVGFYLDGLGNQRGYTDIGGSFASIDPPGSVSTTINGVNDLGQIVGFETLANDSVVGFVGTPTPEPGTLLLMAGALGALGFVRRRIRGRG
jgi:hypothetical protein